MSQWLIADASCISVVCDTDKNDSDTDRCTSSHAFFWLPIEIFNSILTSYFSMSIGNLQLLHWLCLYFIVRIYKQSLKIKKKLDYFFEK